MENEQNEQGQSGFAVNVWCARVGISRATFYTLGNSKPATVKIGDRRIVIEPPTDWLVRMAKAGGVPTKRSARG